MAPPQPPAPYLTWSDTGIHLRATLDLTQLSEGVARAAERLAGAPFDAIAVTGLSGIIFGSALSLRLNKPLVIVRKKEDPQTHSWQRIEGPDRLNTYVFVDDLIASGATFRRVLEQIGSPSSRWPNAKCVGVYCYFEQPMPYQANFLPILSRSHHAH